MKKIVLASGSPRRKEILSNIIGSNFEIAKSLYEEDNTLELPPHELVMKHSKMKGLDVAKNYSDAIVISADSLVSFNEKVLGKPKTESRAKEMLEMISGNTVEVLTGITVIDTKHSIIKTEYETTLVYFDKMTNEDIDFYVRTKEPLDKAGAFGIQGKGALFIQKIDGCFFNVMGLPIFKLHRMLKSLKLKIY